jgi:nitrogen fixation uncharacterized protein
MLIEWLLKEEKGKDMVANTVTADKVDEFLQYLINNPLEREKLQDATAADILQAGKNAGYNFTESDLNAIIQHVHATGGTEISNKQPGCAEAWG